MEWITSLRSKPLRCLILASGVLRWVLDSGVEQMYGHCRVGKKMTSLFLWMFVWREE